YRAWLAAHKAKNASGSGASPWGAIIPAAALLASAPGSPRSKTNTRSLACAKRSAIEDPIKPPPITITSAVRELSKVIAIPASVPAGGLVGHPCGVRVATWASGRIRIHFGGAQVVEGLFPVSGPVTWTGFLRS